MTGLVPLQLDKTFTFIVYSPLQNKFRRGELRYQKQYRQLTVAADNPVGAN